MNFCEKKTELKAAGYEIENRGSRTNTILTTNGEVEIKKTRLRITGIDKESGNSKRSEVIVLDDYFKLKALPHRMTKGLMEKITWWAQHEQSYESARDILRNELHINVSDEYIRTIAMEVGKLVYEDDTKKAFDTDHINAEIPRKWTIDGTLYLMVDGSMINTIVINEDGTAVWKEVKLGMVFNDKDLILKANGEKHRIVRKDFAVSTGNVEECK